MGGPACHLVNKAHPTLIYDHGRPSLPPCQKGSALISAHGRPILPPCRKGSALISDHGMNTSTMSEGIDTYVFHGMNT